MLYECSHAERKRVISVFVDLEKAYDRVDRNKLYTAFVLQLGLDIATVKLLKQMYTDVRG